SGAGGALLLLLGVLQRPADLDQRRPARLGEPEAGEGALEHGELVDAELREAAQLVLAGHAAAGLDVDHESAALLVPLQAVHPAGDLHPGHVDLEPLLGDDQLARVGAVPGDELAHHLIGLLPLAAGVPGAAESLLPPDIAQPAVILRLHVAHGNTPTYRD